MIVVYSTGCPQCKALEMKLSKKNIDFIICEDKEKMVALGMKSAPALQVEDSPLMSFSEAINWVNSQEG